MSCSSHGHGVIPETVRPSSSPDTYIMRSCVPAIHCEWEPHETWCSIHSIPLWAPHVFQFQQPWSQWTDCPGVFQPSTVMNLLLYSSHQHCVTCWCSGYTTTVRPVVIPAIIHCWEVSSLQASTIQNQCDLACSNSRTSYEIQCSSHALLWLLDPPVCKCLSSQHTLWDPMPAPAIIHIMWYYYYQQHQQGGTNKIALTFSDDTMT